MKYIYFLKSPQHYRLYSLHWLVALNNKPGNLLAIEIQVNRQHHLDFCTASTPAGNRTSDWKYFTNFQWKMFSSKTIVWILMLFELVLSCAILIASFAIISKNYENGKNYSITLIFTSITSFSLIIVTIIAMVGLSRRKCWMMLPRISILVGTYQNFNNILIRKFASDFNINFSL
ncbi:unnamed protein product [Dracunculus medinensis]|uniref:PGG domain-containing protein n=1 Tax=Dracunculus medinensis TaxID=318479 RepID=A0A0N4UJF9_DRAME|nr:unnamed protein product [Dracunculus medinensis]